MDMTTILSLLTALLTPVALTPAQAQSYPGKPLRIMREKTTRERLYSFGAEPIDNTPAEFAAYINSEIAKWARVVKSTRIKLE